MRKDTHMHRHSQTDRLCLCSVFHRFMFGNIPNRKDSNDDKKFDTIKNISDHITLIKKAMYKVVNEYGCTAYRYMSSEYSFSGKTGTSQVKRITLSEREEEDFRKKEIEWKKRDHALFVGYMPSIKPKYSISVIIDHGGS